MAPAVVLITGGTRRIGAAIAQHCLTAGWHLAIHSHNSPLPLEWQGRKDVHHFTADLNKETEAESLAAAVIAHYGRLDAIVNNAARFELDDVETFCHDNLLSHLGINTIAPILLARCLYRHVAERNATTPAGRTHDSSISPVVINLLDQKLDNLNPDFLSYTLTKAALAAATTMLAQALSPLVRVSSVSPGITLPSTHQSPSNFASASRHSLLQRATDPEDIARAVVFLIANASITGANLTVDAGQHLYPTGRDVMFL